MKSALGTYSGDSSEAVARKLKDVWNRAALNKSTTTSKEISFHPVRSSVLVEALAKSDCFGSTTSGGLVDQSKPFSKLLRSRLDTYGINAAVTQERFVRETLKAMDEHSKNTSDDKENTTVVKPHNYKRASSVRHWLTGPTNGHPHCRSTTAGEGEKGRRSEKES